MSIRIWTGRPGTGKTYTLVAVLLKELNRGRIVYSNFFIDWHGNTMKKWRFIFTKVKIFRWSVMLPLPRQIMTFNPPSNLRSWTKLSDLLMAQNAIIAIDEAHFYLNSRKWKELPMDFMRKIAEHRKDGLHIYGTVQNVNRLDVVARELIDYWYVCRKIPFFVLATEFDIDEDEQKKHPIYTSFRLFRKKIYSRYDTLRKISHV